MALDTDDVKTDGSPDAALTVRMVPCAIDSSCDIGRYSPAPNPFRTDRYSASLTTPTTVYVRTSRPSTDARTWLPIGLSPGKNRRANDSLTTITRGLSCPSRGSKSRPASNRMLYVANQPGSTTLTSERRARSGNAGSPGRDSTTVFQPLPPSGKSDDTRADETPGSAATESRTRSKNASRFSGLIDGGARTFTVSSGLGSNPAGADVNADNVRRNSAAPMMRPSDSATCAMTSPWRIFERASPAMARPSVLSVSFGLSRPMPSAGAR